MNIIILLFLRVRLHIIRSILILLSLPLIHSSCKNLSQSATGDQTYQPRTDLPPDNPGRNDSIIPVWHDPYPVTDYGTLHIDSVRPVFYEPVPMPEYGVVYPEPTE
jgi:hypothetical protein